MRYFIPLLLAGWVHAADWPYESGTSTHTLEGLKCVLVVPDELSRKNLASLAIILHGSGGSAEGMAHAMAPCAGLGYIVLAPKSTGDRSWSDADMKAVERIVAGLKTKLPIDPRKVHVAGYSNGGWFVEKLAFSDAIRPCSATWVGAGYRGGRVAKWAKKELGALALAGTDDPNAPHAQATVTKLNDKVRSAECRLQPGIGHNWPDKLMPYMRWWMGVQEGRFVPGEDHNFEWSDDLPEAKKALLGKKKGGILVYFFDKSDKDRSEAKKLQNEVLMDPAVRFFGRQLQCVKLEKEIFTDEATELGVKTTPAIVVVTRKGKIKKRIEGRIKARSLASALKSVAPNKKLPKN